MHIEVGGYRKFRGVIALVTQIERQQVTTIAQCDSHDWTRPQVERVTPLDIETFNKGDVVTVDLERMFLQTLEGKHITITTWEKVRKIEDGRTRPEAELQTQHQQAEGDWPGAESWESVWEPPPGTDGD